MRKITKLKAEVDSSVPRQYSLVKIAPWYSDFLKEKGVRDCPLLHEKHFIFLGEIPNMPGHCVVAGQTTGKIISGYHTENFVELSDAET